MAQASDSLKGQLVGALRNSSSCFVVPLDLLEFNTTAHCLRPVSPGFVTAPHNSSSSSVLAQGPRPGDSGPSSSPQVVIESDLYAPRPLELLPHTDRRDGEGRRSEPSRTRGCRVPIHQDSARPGRCIPALRGAGASLRGSDP